MVSKGDFLFPGKQQEHMFNRLLSRILSDKKEEIKSMGYELSQIGSHSIWKGAAPCLTSMPGKFISYINNNIVIYFLIFFQVVLLQVLVVCVVVGPRGM